MNKLLTTVLFSGFLGLSTMSASADVLSTIQGFTLNDIKQAEAIYAANPQVPTAPAAMQCLKFADAALTQKGGAGITLGAVLLPPQGVASTIADLDVALSTNNGGLSPIVNQFNQYCGWYMEDLKAAAAAHAATHSGVLSFFGL